MLDPAALRHGDGCGHRCIERVLDGRPLAQELAAWERTCGGDDGEDSLPLEIGGVDYRRQTRAHARTLTTQTLGNTETIFWRHNSRRCTVREAPVLFQRPEVIPPRKGGVDGTWVNHDVGIQMERFYTTGVEKTNPWVAR